MMQTYAQTNNSQLATSIRPDGNAPDASAILDVQSPNQGVLLPRMDNASIQAIPSPAAGLMVYDTELLCLRIYNGAEWNCLNQISGGGSSNTTASSFKVMDVSTSQMSQ